MQLLGCAIVFFVEAFDAAGRVDHLLFAREERMALRANFNVVIAKRGTRFDDGTAGACDFRRFVIRMNTFFHIVLS